MDWGLGDGAKPGEALAEHELDMLGGDVADRGFADDARAETSVQPEIFGDQLEQTPTVGEIRHAQPVTGVSPYWAVQPDDPSIEPDTTV